MSSISTFIYTHAEYKYNEPTSTLCTPTLSTATPCTPTWCTQTPSRPRTCTSRLCEYIPCLPGTPTLWRFTLFTLRTLRFCTYLRSASAVVIELWAAVTANESLHPLLLYLPSVMYRLYTWTLLARRKLDTTDPSPNINDGRHPFVRPRRPLCKRTVCKTCAGYTHRSGYEYPRG